MIEVFGTAVARRALPGRSGQQQHATPRARDAVLARGRLLVVSPAADGRPL
jgi:hypothetical protein